MTEAFSIEALMEAARDRTPEGRSRLFGLLGQLFLARGQGLSEGEKRGFSELLGILRPVATVEARLELLDQFRRLGFQPIGKHLDRGGGAFQRVLVGFACAQYPIDVGAKIGEHVGQFGIGRQAAGDVHANVLHNAIEDQISVAVDRAERWHRQRCRCGVAILRTWFGCCKGRHSIALPVGRRSQRRLSFQAASLG